MLESIYKLEEGDRKKELKNIDTEIGLINESLLKTDKLFVSETIDKNSYQRLKEAYQNDLLQLQHRQIDIQEIDTDFIKQMEFAFQVMSNLEKLWLELDLEGKHALLGSIFSEELIFENGIYRTTSPNNLLSEIFNIGAGFDNHKKEKAPISGSLSGKVGHAGIEPATHRL
jgi:hypothetical protein